ncbi:MAG TPA: hypothetical protein DDZ80_31615 [Cyanobacteria bacterium UBA8803]|nr:hypothetical protein [Cyanobacteria bacterium UBA9273]HBL62759.1 hypothetical protein [Cyanobacteria bacterium UBA8803]
MAIALKAKLTAIGALAGRLSTPIEQPTTGTIGFLGMGDENLVTFNTEATEKNSPNSPFP